MNAHEAAERAAESVQDWAETAHCIMLSRAHGVDHQAKLILDEFAPLLAAKDAELAVKNELIHDLEEMVSAAESRANERGAEIHRLKKYLVEIERNPHAPLLLAERDRLAAEVDSWRRDCAAIEEERDQLVVEVAELRRDAERYRWLRTHSFVNDVGEIHFGPGCNQTKPELLDDAIADAMRYPIVGEQ